MHAFTTALVKYTVFKYKSEHTGKILVRIILKIFYPVEEHEVYSEMLACDLSHLFGSVLAVLSIHKCIAFYETHYEKKKP